MSNNNNTNDPRITQTIIYLVLWILNMLKKKKSSKLKKNALRRFSAIFGPEINSLTCDFFIYEAILAFFFVLFVLMIFYCIEYQKFIFGQIRALRCILFSGVVGGGHALTYGSHIFTLFLIFFLIIW